MRYVGEARLVDLAANVRRLHKDKKAVDSLIDGEDFDEEKAGAAGPAATNQALAREVIAQGLRVKELARQVSDTIIQERQTTAERLEMLSEKIEQAIGDYKFVLNTSSYHVHVVASSSSSEACAWRTNCGWVFAGARSFRLFRTKPTGCTYCSRCGLSPA